MDFFLARSITDLETIVAIDLTVGDPAPNFDLTSTENVVLMLRDEVPRVQVLLYFFDGVHEATGQLVELARGAVEWAGKGIRILGISQAPLEDLAAAQQKNGLPFPLLHDDRELSALYGAGCGEGSVAVLVDHDQRIAMIERQPQDLSGSVSSFLAERGKRRNSTANYPTSVINRLVKRWVN
jgi:peroxiredoxin